MKLKTVKIMLIGVLFISVLAFSVALSNPVIESVSAVGVVCPDGTTVSNGADCAYPDNTPTCLFGPGCAFTTIVNTALFLIGSIAVLMLIYGGIRYTISGGNEKSVTAAKNTILYAVVGIVVAVLAFAIVNFVLTALISTPSGG